MSQSASELKEAGPITIVFTDAEGSTALQAERGDGPGRAALDAIDQVVRGCIPADAGRVIKSLGDGLMIAFVSSRSAVNSALAILGAVAQHCDANPHLGLRVRIGVHTGEVLESEADLRPAIARTPPERSVRNSR